VATSGPASHRVERDPIETRSEHLALGWMALAAAGAIAWIVRPVGVGILLGTLLAFMAQPLFEWLERRLGARASALAVVTAATLALAAVLGGLGWLFVARGTILTRDLIAALGPGAPGGGVLERIGTLSDKIGIPPDELARRARALAETAMGRAEAVARVLAATTASTLLMLFFTMLSMHFIIRRWEALALGAEQTLPLRPSYTAELFAEFKRVGRTTLLGTMVTGIAQGLLATMGFWITGAREPVFFGAATAVASLVPVVGTLLVWVPVGIVLILIGHPARGVLELVWGAVIVVGVVDYVVRPRLVRGEKGLPSLVMFAALFGGVEVFGLKGLIVGPVLMSLAIAVLRLYASEARRRRFLQKD
jgi:predicted PurR-regulated permease PerM